MRNYPNGIKPVHTSPSSLYNARFNCQHYRI